MDLIFYG